MQYDLVYLLFLMKDPSLSNSGMSVSGHSGSSGASTSPVNRRSKLGKKRKTSDAEDGGQVPDGLFIRVH